MDNWSWSDQGGEKKGVAPPPACENSSVVERCLAKAEVEGSTPFFRPPPEKLPRGCGARERLFVALSPPGRPDSAPAFQ